MRGAATNRGGTLIETVMAVVVLGVAIPPLLQLFTEVARHDADHSYQGAALNAAEALLEEIVSKDFEDPDLPIGSFGTEELTRSAYDDVDDFDGFLEASATIRGQVLGDGSGLSRRVWVDNVTADEPDPAIPAADGTTGFKRIRVTVAWKLGGGGEITLSTLRSRLDIHDWSSPLDEAASAASLVVGGPDYFSVDLVNAYSTYVILDSFELSADVPTSPLSGLKLEGKQVWNGPFGDVDLPTGQQALNKGTIIERAVLLGTAPNLEVQMGANPVGTVTYTLVLHFTNGSSSTITIPINW